MGSYDEDKVYVKSMNEKIEAMTGPAGQLAKSFQAVYQASFYGGYQTTLYYCEGINRGITKEAVDLRNQMIGDQTDIKAVLDNGLREFFLTLAGPVAGQQLVDIVAHLPDYIYQHSSYRRSFRSENLNSYYYGIYQVMESVYFDWSKFDLAAFLKMSREQIRESKYPLPNGILILHLIATAIDSGNQEVIETIKDIVLSDNNVRIIDHILIKGVAKSHSREMHELMRDLLLAAKLQEGLRQAILETADDGCLEYFMMIIQTVLEHNLLRFSSCIRAVNVWMGLGYEADTNDRRGVTKLLEKAYEYLQDPAAKEEALFSRNQIEIYAAMFAESVVSVEQLMRRIEQLMDQEQYQKLTALYFMGQTDQHDWNSRIASRYLGEKDLDVLCYVLANYSLSGGWGQNREDYMNSCKNNPLLKDQKARTEQFEQLKQLLERIPKGGYVCSGKPFEWSGASISRSSVFSKMLIIACYDEDLERIDQLIDLTDYAESDSRINLINYVLDANRSEKERSYIFGCLSDKSMPVRTAAVELLAKLKLSDEELLQVENLLALKTGKIRQGALEILKKLDAEKRMASIGRMIADKNSNKRLGALDLLSEMTIAGSISKEQVNETLALMPKVTEQEQVLVDKICADEQVVYDISNGYGLYNPDYRPKLPPITGNQYTLEEFRKITKEQIIQTLETLTAVIEQHKDKTFMRRNWDGTETEVALGGQQIIMLKDVENQNRNQNNTIDDYVLAEEWKKWQAENGRDLLLLTKISFCHTQKNYQGQYRLPYSDWANELLKKLYGYEELEAVCNWIAKAPYGILAANIIRILLKSADQREQFEIAYGLLADHKNYLTEEDWKRKIESSQRSYYQSTNVFSDSSHFEFFLERVNSAKEDDCFERALGMCYEFGALEGYQYIGLNEVKIARAVSSGIVDINDLYRTFMRQNPTNKMAIYTAPQNRNRKANIEKYPVLAEVTDRVVAQVIAIEIKRGDLKTAVSEIAQSIRCHRGVENFVNILVALGKESMTRGYNYGGVYSKKDVLSSLLKHCLPDEGDDAEKLRKYAAGRISDKRMLEAAMYVPAWISIVQEYLGWKGLKSAAWYFHAHTSNGVSAEYETEVARFSPISIQNFRDGAFDINWFKSAYKELGKEKFAVLYDCAKYISDGGTHRRAQLFADAVLGKLNKKDMKKNIADKRNKDQMLSYSLVPFARNRMKDALERYEFIQQFLKESKQFGAQRRESEGKICAIAMDNLARNLGYADSLRFTWKMEVLKIDQIKQYFDPYLIDGVALYLSVNEDGTAEIMVSRDDKPLKSVPAALKKHSYVLELKKIKASMKDQYVRAKASLERALENRDCFSFGEITDLLSHPVICPLVKNLVFKGAKGIGFLEAEGLRTADGSLIPLEAEEDLVIAHCVDLHESGNWSYFQRYAFEKQIRQPFKQIFRELYMINADEQKEKVLSRRYAGHQVQPKRTLALLKSRKWTVDYDMGLQKVYYKENVVATIYALADWFSPADIEAPTLETVRFYDRKTGDPLELTKIDPVIFSETMRDVDLVVSVAHVGGVDPMASHSTIEMRAVIITEMLRMLKIENVQVAGSHAKIKGQLGEYTVHLGSGIVHKMGAGALNILPVHSQQRGRIFLPFIDEDPKTAEITSKILLLAEDQKIKDPTVREQLS